MLESPGCHTRPAGPSPASSRLCQHLAGWAAWGHGGGTLGTPRGPQSCASLRGHGAGGSA